MARDMCSGVTRNAVQYIDVIHQFFNFKNSHIFRVLLFVKKKGAGVRKKKSTKVYL